MNIGFDAKRAFLNHTGLGNYSRTVIRSLVHYFPENNYSLYTTALGKHSFGNIAQDNSVQVKLPSTKPHSYWRSRKIIQDLTKDKIQIYHGLSNELPFGIRRTGIASVVTVHDLIFLRYPKLYPFFDRKMYKLKTKYACQNANKIIAVSQQTKEDLINYIGVKEEKINVIYQCIDDVFLQQTKDWQTIKNKYNIPDKYILNVGTIEERKNLLLLVRALKNTDPDTALVVVGRATPYWNEVQQYIAQNNLQNRVLHIPNIVFSDLPAIYKNAVVFVYPSRFEGFGIPVLEAISSGVPVIAATGSCLEESGGEASIYISPDDENALSSELNKVLDYESLRNQMIQSGLKHSKKFSAERIAIQLMQLYKSL